MRRGPGSTASQKRGSAGPGAPVGIPEKGISKKIVEDAIFSVLYALRPTGSSSFRLSVVALVCEFIQIISFPLNPVVFPWKHPPYVSDVVEALTSIFPPRFMSKMPYASFAILFAVALVVLVGCLAAGAAIFVKKNRFRYQWPVRLLKSLFGLVFATLYVSFISVLLRPLDCRYLASGAAAPTPYMHASYPTVECWGMPNAILSFIAIVATVLFGFVAHLRALVDCDPNCGTTALLATATTYAPFRGLIVRGMLPLTTLIVSGYPSVLGVILAMEFGYLVYLIIRYLPYYAVLANCATAGVYAAGCWTSILAAASYIAGDGVPPLVFSALFLAGSPGAFAAAYMGARARFNRFCNADFVGLNDDGGYTYYREPQVPYHVEIAARFVRDARNKKNDDLDQDLVDRGEAVYQAGLKKFPKHGSVYLAFSNYLKVFKGNGQLEAVFVDRSRHLQLDVQERFAVYRKDREKEQSSSGDLGEQSMDLASYVEFQKQFKAAKEGHLKTVRATKLFWQTLLEEDEVAFAKMPEIFKLIDTHETVAEKNYLELLAKYPRSVRVLRAFGSFVEQVKNDTLLAEDYFRFADAEEEEISRRNAEMGNREDAVNSGAIDNSRNGVVIMGSNEVITSVNAITCRLWGYKRNEMVGKRINMLMPSPFREDHHQYVTSYLRTGVAKVVNIPRSVYGLHRDGYIFPFKLYVTRLDVNGVVTFVGAITPVETDNGIMLVTAAGRVTACNREAAALFEMGIEELCSRDVKVLVPPRYWGVFDANADPRERELRGVSTRRTGTSRQNMIASGASFRQVERRPSGGSHAPSIAKSAAERAETTLTYSSKIVSMVETEVQGLAKDGSVFPLSVKVARMFEGEKALLAVTLTEVEDTDALLSIDVRGIIRSCNKHACVMFGYTPVELNNQKIENLMPAPYSTYHHTYLERYLRTGEAHVIGSKRAVDGKHKSGSTFGIVLDISRVDVGNEIIFVGRITRNNEEENDALITINQEGMIQNCNAACSALWGYRTSEMVGRNVKMLMPPHYAANHDGYLATYMRTRKANVIGTGGRSLEGLHQDGTTFPIQLEVMEDTTLAGQGVTLFQGRVSKLSDMDALITITKEGVIKSCNKNLCRMWGVKATEDLVGKNVKVLMDPSIAAEHDGYLRRYLETGEARVVGKKRKLEGRHSDGSSFPLTLEVSELNVSGEKLFSARILYNAAGAGEGGVMFKAAGEGPPKAAATLEPPAPARAGPPSALKGGSGPLREKTGLHRRGHGGGEGAPAPAPPPAPVPPPRKEKEMELEPIEEGSDDDAFVLSLAPAGNGAVKIVEGFGGSGASGTSRSSDALFTLPRPASGSSVSSHGSRHRHLVDPLDLNRRPDLRKRRGSKQGEDGESARSGHSGPPSPSARSGRSDGRSDAVSAQAAAAHDRIRSFLSGASVEPAGSTTAPASSNALAEGAGALRGGPDGKQGAEREGSEAGHSQASSTTTKKRRRRKRLELLAAAAKRNSGVEQLWRNIVISNLALAVLCVVAFVAVQQILAQYAGSIKSIAASGDRALAAQMALLEARSLHIAAARAVAPPGAGADWRGLPAASISPTLDGDALNATAARLAGYAADLNSIHLSMTLGSNGFQAPSSDALRELNEQPVLSLAEFVDTVPPRILTANMSLWTAGEKMVQNALLVAGSARFVAAGPPSVASASPAEPSRCLYSPSTCRALQFVLRNGPDGVLEGMERAMEAYGSEVSSSQAIVRTVYVVSVAISLAVIAALALVVFGPTLKRVRLERDAIFLIFLEVPKAAVRIQAQRKVTVKMESDEETDDEDDEEGEGEGQQQQPKEEEKRRGISFGAGVQGNTERGDKRGKGEHIARKPSSSAGSGAAGGSGEAGPPAVHALDDFGSVTSGGAGTAGGQEAGDSRHGKEASDSRRGSRKGSLIASITSLFSRASAYEVRPQSSGRQQQQRPGSRGAGRGPQRRLPKEPGALERLSGRLFRHYSAQYVAALAITAVFFIAIFVAGFSLVQTFNDDSNEIKVASSRAVRAMHLLHLAREFVLDQAAFPAVTPLLRERIVADVARLRREHAALVRGGGAKSYAPLAELTFRATCLRKRKADCLTPGDIDYPATSNGLDSLMTFFFDQVDLLVADADADRAANLPSSAQGPSDGAANARFRTVWGVGRADVLEGLQASVELYEEAAKAVVQTVVPMHGALMGGTLGALFLMFFFLFRPMVRNLKDETRRTRRMLMLVPEDVADKMESINEYLRGSEDGQYLEA